MSNPRPTVVNVRMDQTKPVACPRCGCEAFYEIRFLREVPALLSPTGKSEMTMLPAMECLKCRHVFEFGKKVEEKVKKGLFLVSFLLSIVRAAKDLFRK